MNAQDLLITNRLIAIDLFYNDGYHFSYEGKDYNFATRAKVHEFFHKNTPYDTVKLFYEGQKSYVHFFHEEVEIYDTKKSLPSTLSQDGGGAWAEERNGKKHYFIEEKGWLTIAFKQVTKEECFQKLEAPFTLQKALGLGLGILALAPGMCEFARQLPVGAKEAVTGLLALQYKNPLLATLSLLPNVVEAQAMGTEFQVNTYTASEQRNPSIAPLIDGGFVVTWESSAQDGDGKGVFGQRYAANGSTSSDEFQVNTYTTSNQWRSSVAGLTGGEFVITWDGGGDIFGQIYAANGTSIGMEFRVNNYTADSQYQSDVAMLNNGGFVATWQSMSQDVENLGVFGQRYNSLGAPIGDEFQINTYAIGSQEFPSVTGLSNGGFVVAWDSFPQDTAGFGIYGQRYDSIGVPLRGEFQVNNYTLGSQLYPSIAALSDGGFVVTWESGGQDGDSNGIFGQKYDSVGIASGVEFQVNNFTAGNQRYPSVAPFRDGGFIVTWQSNDQDGDWYGIYGQRYDINGTPIGAEFQVNTYTTRGQENPSVAVLNDGGFVVVWDSNGQDGNQTGIYGQRYDSNGSAIETLLPSMTRTSALPTPSLTRSSWIMPSMSSTLLNRSTSSPPFLGQTIPSLGRTVAISQITPSISSEARSSLILSAAFPSRLQTSFQVPVIFVVTQIVYEQPYSIILNGQTVGNYTVSGGTGLLNSQNPNMLNIQFNANYSPNEGDIIPLFAIPEGQQTDWARIQLGEIFFECLEAFEEIVPSSESGSNFQIVFEEADSCVSLAPKILTSVMAMTTT